MSRVRAAQIGGPRQLSFDCFKSGSPAFPPIARGFEAVARILSERDRLIGLDVEFDSSGPTILGVADESSCAAASWKECPPEFLRKALLEPRAGIVAHAGISADRIVVERALGISTPRDLWKDSLILHYLENQDLCLAPSKEEDEGASLGLMNLWTAASLVTMVPQWKICRGLSCDGPCPSHDPFYYCATDAWAGLLIWKSYEKAVNPDLYRALAELSEICQIMQDRGILIDRDFVRREMTKHDSLRRKIAEDLPFNPDSPKSVLEYFPELKSASKDSVLKLLQKKAERLGYSLEDPAPDEDLPEDFLALRNLYEYKRLGKGMDAWFADKYLDSEGRIHPRFIVTGTSTGRLSSSNPNFQNIPSRGWGKHVKKAIVPRPGCRLVEADFSQLELRMVLFLAGYDMKNLPKDAFSWLVERCEGAFDRAAKNTSMSARDIAKSVSHAADYLEGFQILRPADLASGRTKKAIEAGALRVYRDWDFGGGVVAFNGINLAARLFGDSSWENRRRALEIQEDIYFRNFPEIRKWHQKVLLQLAEKGYVQSPTGRHLACYGDFAENAKQAAAFFGQGVSADHVQGCMRLFYRHAPVKVPLIQVHDSLVWEVPEDWGPEKIREFLEPMRGGSDLLPDFRAPIKTKAGRNYGELEEI